MNQSRQRYIDKLNTALDRMLESAAFRQKAKVSGLLELAVAARLIEKTHPQLSVISKHLIREQMLEAVDEQHITPEDTAKIDALLEDTSSQAPSSGARARMLAKMMATVPDSTIDHTLSLEAKQRMQSPMLEAQRKLQIDALVTSDEALEIAKSSDDPIVQAAVALRNAKHPAISAESKQRILEHIVPEQGRKPLLSPNFGASLRRIAASIAILLFVSLLMAPTASADSLPGDQLYPVKRGLETISLQLVWSDAQRVKTHLRIANERLDELTRLPANSSFKPQLLDAALTHLEAASILVSDDIVQHNDVRATVMRFESVLQSTDLADAAGRMALTERYQALQPATPVIVVPQSPELQAPLTESTPEVTEVAPTDVPDVPTETPQPDSPATEPQILYGYASGLINVRVEPIAYAEIIDQIEPLQAVTVIATTDDTFWTQVELEDGQMGWIASYLLATAPITPPIVDNANSDDQGTSPSVEISTQGTDGAGTQSTNTNGQPVVADDDERGNANGNANGNSTGNRQDERDDDDD